MARLMFSETHEGEFWGISPTGRRIAVQYVHWCRFANGKVMKYRAVRYYLGMLQQLDVVPVLRNL